MTVELRHLRCFVVVAEELHFGRASKRLHLGQPAVSRVIADMERRVGMPLFERTSREVRLTHQGASLLTGARETIRSADELMLTARATRDAQRGRFVVALHDEGAAELTTPILQAFAAKHPGVQVDVCAPDYTQLVTVLDRGEADAVLSGGRWSSAYETAVVFRDGRGLLVGPRSPFFDAEAISVAEAAEAPFAGSADQDTNRFFGGYWLEEYGGSSQRGCVVTDGSGLQHRVRMTDAVTAASASSLRFWPIGDLRFVPLPDAEPLPLTAAIPARSPTPLQRSFLAVAEATGRALAHRMVPSAAPAS